MEFWNCTLRDLYYRYVLVWYYDRFSNEQIVIFVITIVFYISDPFRFIAKESTKPVSSLVFHVSLYLGGSPYTRIDARNMKDLLIRGYRMPKPSHVDGAL